MTVDETATVLGISRSTAYDQVRTGAIPSIRLGRRIVIPTANIRKMLRLDGVDAETPPA
jgi:excisionase family DNA binding protein